jgi:glutathione synthase/RimK-type ligase-like ATP-grasp enzyme
MKESIIVIDEKFKSDFDGLGIEVFSPIEYILMDTDKKTKQVYNLSSELGYQDLGYYVSLLAMARKDKVIPSAQTIQDFKDRKIQKLFSEEIDGLIQQKLKNIKAESYDLSVYFGSNLAEGYQKISWELYRLIQAPLFRVYFQKDTEWSVRKIKILTYKDISDLHKTFVVKKAEEYVKKKKTFKSLKKSYLYDLAMLYNPNEESPPSDKKALELFEESFKKVGFYTDVAQAKEITNISEYDALFIRETTNVSHYTYRIARKADKEGLVVIDDPESIVKCTNKIFLEQMLDRLDIKRPKTFIYDKKMFDKNIAGIQFPCVIKKPDSAFSQGVHKAKTREELLHYADSLFKSTDLILIQEFLPTDFDWRIGVLNGEVLYACKYFMAKEHWQIINNDNNHETGEFESCDYRKVDDNVIRMALKASNAIGKGLYGVDIKQKGSDVYLIEVNDNPSIDHGVEDKFLGPELYVRIAKHFLELCNAKKGIYA